MDPLVTVHAAGGVMLLVLGVTAALAPKRRRHSPHRRVGQAYVGLLVVVLTSGMVIGLGHAGVTFFEIATPPTLVAGLVGFAAARAPLRRRLGRHWKIWHLTGMGSSLIGVVTASAFQVVPRFAGDGLVTSMLLWIVPTVVGSVLINRAVARQLRPRPAAPIAA